MALRKNKQGRTTDDAYISEAQALERERRKQRFEEKRENELRRKEARDKRSAAQQLALLDDRLGKNQGAQKERARLMREIEKQGETKEKAK